MCDVHGMSEGKPNDLLQLSKILCKQGKENKSSLGPDKEKKSGLNCQFTICRFFFSSLREVELRILGTIAEYSPH